MKELNVRNIHTLIISFRNQTLLPRVSDVAYQSSQNPASNRIKRKDNPYHLSLEYVCF